MFQLLDDASGDLFCNICGHAIFIRNGQLLVPVPFLSKNFQLLEDSKLFETCFILHNSFLIKRWNFIPSFHSFLRKFIATLSSVSFILSLFCLLSKAVCFLMNCWHIHRAENSSPTYVVSFAPLGNQHFDGILSTSSASLALITTLYLYRRFASFLCLFTSLALVSFWNHLGCTVSDFSVCFIPILPFNTLSLHTVFYLCKILIPNFSLVYT